MPDLVRTFIAIELDQETRHALYRIQEVLKIERAGRHVRWVAPEGIHLTLKFLGGVDAGMLPAIQQATAQASAGTPRFSLGISGLGAFPNARRPNVIWVGMTGDVQAAEQLADRIDAACASLGFPREIRPFNPHLTLGRVKRDARLGDQQFVGEMVAKVEVGQLAKLQVEQVCVIKSDLGPGGAKYTRLYAVPLVD